MIQSVDVSSSSGVNLDQYMKLGGLHSDKTHLDTLTATIMRNRRSENPTSTMNGTANSLRNAMMVYKKQQLVLQENAKAMLELKKSLDGQSVSEIRTKQMTSLYGVKNPRVNYTNHQ